MRTPLGQRERVVSDNGNVWWRYHNAAKCKDCGCTNANECRNAHGNGIPCFWVSSEEDWCSRCAGVTLHLPPGHARQIQAGGAE